MTKLASINIWHKLVQQNIFIEFIDVTLRGCGQVMFQNNPLTGLLFFIAIFLGAYFEGMPHAGFACLLGTLVATLTAYCYKLDKDSLQAGLFGYNGCLVGIGLATFLTPSFYLWIVVIFGSIVSVITTKALANFLKSCGVAALTAPFVLVTWTILLAGYAFFGIKGIGFPHPTTPDQFTTATAQYLPQVSVIIPDVFRGVSEVFLLSSMSVGIIFIIGLAVNSVSAAIYALLGSLISIIAAYFLQANLQTVNVGLYSFSAVLTAIALGSTFNKPSIRVTIYTILGVIFTVFVQGALDTALAPIGIPTLTMPFVLATWMFLVANQDFIVNNRAE